MSNTGLRFWTNTDFVLQIQVDCRQDQKARVQPSHHQGRPQPLISSCSDPHRGPRIPQIDDFFDRNLVIIY